MESTFRGLLPARNSSGVKKGRFEFIANSKSAEPERRN